MEAKVPAGKYVLAVSGGVDSMVLLDLLSNLDGVELVAAHFNHGIRPDSIEDERLVAAAAKDKGLPFEAGRGQLGAGASEAVARKARYGFLTEVKTKHGTRAIITAHHQDDLIETALINLLRGTGRRGLVAISDNQAVMRPLLNYPKSEIISYAKKNKLKWREDPTNASPDYLRNHIRRNLMPKMTTDQRREFLKNLNQVSKTGRRMDAELSILSSGILDHRTIDRSKFSALPAALGNELLTYWLRQEGLMEFDKRTISRLNVALRTARGLSTHPVKDNLSIEIAQKTARFERRPLR
jgi:tRNA(Ile)-lysidine synthetase-like protein